MGSQRIAVNIYHVLRRCSVVFVVALSILAVLLSMQTVFAADSLKGLTLAPLRTEISLAPGTSHSGTLTVTNSTDDQMTVDMGAEEFSVINQNYDYSFSPDTDISRWVSFNPSEVVLKPGQSKKIPYTLGVPLTAEPGGAYISLFASTVVGMPDEGASSRQRVASLLYISVFSDVLGDTTRVGHLLSLSSPWFVTDKATWGATLQNSDISHYRSDYEVKVENLFGGTAAEMSGSALILPGTIRAITDTLPLPKLPGLYKVVYSIGLGKTPSPDRVHYMLYMPPLAIVAVVAVIVILVAEILRRRNKKR